MATRSTLRNLVLEATGRSDKTSLINSALDLALEEISAEHHWSDLRANGSVTVTQSSPSVDLASDLARLKLVRIMETDGNPAWELDVRSEEWVLARYTNPLSDSESKPLFGYLLGKTLYLVPLPDNSYTIRYSYTKVHPAFTGDSDSLQIRAASAAVVAWATYWVFQSLEKHDDAARWLSTYEKSLMKAMRLDRDNSAERIVADRRDKIVTPPNYWEDPFVKRVP